MIYLSQKRNAPVLFAMPPLLTSVSYSMGNTVIKLASSKDQSALEVKCIMYTMLAGNVSVGKSPIFTSFKEQLYNIEKMKNINDNESQITNCGTVVALIERVKQKGSVYTSFDEASTFWGSLGKYSDGGDQYDRSIFLELFGGSIFIRDLKSERTIIKEPRLNITIAEHIDSLTEKMKWETKNCDGLMQRFLFCAPNPLFGVSNNEIRSSRQPKISIIEILYTISEIFNQNDPMVMIYEEESLELMDKLIDSYRLMIEKANNLDNFIA